MNKINIDPIKTQKNQGQKTSLNNRSSNNER